MFGTNDIFGCDIGNGFAYLSVLEQESSDPMPLLPAKLKAEGMPSAAYIVPPEGEKIEVYGTRSALQKYGPRNPERMVHAIKTQLKNERIKVDGMGVKTDDVYAAIVRDLVILGNGERRNQGKEPVYDLVFTFPAAFAEDVPLLNRMQESIENMTVEGHRLHVVARLPEPAAVAIDYLYYMRHIISVDKRIRSDAFTVLVYDLGHGTFDTAVVRVSEGRIPELLIKDGLPDVGGKNFDEAIYNELCGLLQREYGIAPRSAIDKEHLREAAVSMKHQLSSAEESVERIYLEGDYREVELTRERFEEISEDLVLQTMSLVSDVLEEAESRGIKPDAVVLSGGGSQMPMIGESLEAILEEGEIPVRIYRPSEAVSFGAARYALGEKRREERNAALEQFADHSYGIRLEDEVIYLVKGGEKLPASSEKLRLRAVSDEVMIRLYRSKEKGAFSGTSDMEEAQSMLWFPFVIPEDTCFDVSLTVLEDYNVKVRCILEDGTTYEKSTADGVGILHGKGAGNG